METVLAELSHYVSLVLDFLALLIIGYGAFEADMVEVRERQREARASESPT